HMMFRGTKNFPGSVYDSIVTTLGADANAYTTDDYTAYHLTFSADDLEQVMEIESDRFQYLDYAEAEFKTESGAVYGEFRKGRVNPWFVLHETIMNTAFDKHTYKHTTIGFEADIAAMPQMYEYSRNFFNRYYRPENVVIIIAGAVDSEKTFAHAEKYYGNWNKGYVTPQITNEPVQKKERYVEADFKGKTLPIIDVGYKGGAFAPQDRLYAAMHILGELAFGPNSDLYKKLVIREQRLQLFGYDYTYNRDPRLFEIYAMVKSEDDIQSVRMEIDKTIDQFKTQPVNEQKLNDLKDRLRYEFLMRLDTPDRVAGSLARFAALSGGIEVIDQLYNTFQQVTVSDVMEAARKNFSNERRTTALLRGGK
ncbi:MAG: M16 family metallopeptidase, partial [Calditrichaceae bacterium]